MSKKSTGTEVSKFDDFSEEELEIIKNLCRAYKSTATRKTIQYKKMLKKHGRKAIYRKVESLGLRLPRSAWTPQEDELILKEGKVISRIIVRNKLPHRTFASVMDRFYFLGVNEGRLAPPQGFVFLQKASEITGLDSRMLRKVAKEHKVFIFRYMGRKNKPKKFLYYIEEEGVRQAAEKHFNHINESVTVSDIVDKFGGITRAIVERAADKAGIPRKSGRGKKAYFSKDDAAKIISIIENSLENRTGYITVDEACAKYGLSKDFILNEVEKNPNMCRKVSGITYVGEISISRIRNRQMFTVKKLSEEFGVAPWIVTRTMTRVGIKKSGVKGKKMFISEEDAERVRSVLAHRKVMLECKSGTEVDA